MIFPIPVMYKLMEMFLNKYWAYQCVLLLSAIYADWNPHLLLFVYYFNSSEPAAVGGSGFQFLPLKKSEVDWNRYENHPISQLKNYAYLDENMPYPIQPISHYAAAYKFTIHTFYLAVAQDRHKPPGESGHVSLFTRSYACAALKISGRPLLS